MSEYGGVPLGLHIPPEAAEFSRGYLKILEKDFRKLNKELGLGLGKKDIKEFVKAFTTPHSIIFSSSLFSFLGENERISEEVILHERIHKGIDSLRFQKEDELTYDELMNLAEGFMRKMEVEQLEGFDKINFEYLKEVIGRFQNRDELYAYIFSQRDKYSFFLRKFEEWYPDEYKKVINLISKIPPPRVSINKM
ncbi:MAG: hypothetical protein QXU40_01985 [Candidatus Pacearchaeota archaeon]